MTAPDFTLRHCVSWNENELSRAIRDVSNPQLVVPRHAIKRVGGKPVPLTQEEYRDSRHADVDRYERNITHLTGLLA